MMPETMGAKIVMAKTMILKQQLKMTTRSIIKIAMPMARMMSRKKMKTTLAR